MKLGFLACGVFVKGCRSWQSNMFFLKYFLCDTEKCKVCLFYMYKNWLKNGCLIELSENLKSIEELNDDEANHLELYDDRDLIPLKTQSSQLYLTDTTKHAAMLPIFKDKTTLEGYQRKWKHFKYLLSMGFIVQLLRPIPHLSLN